MKTLTKFLSILALGTVIFTSCQKDPNLNDLDNKYIVQTEYKDGTDFNKLSSYFINDTVYVIGGSKDEKVQKWDYETNERAKALIDEVKANLDSRGYTEQNDTVGVDMTIQLTYFQNTQFFVGGNYNWWNYWNTWGGGWYWGYYPYYPSYYYPAVYSYKIGTFIIDVMDNKATPVMIKGEDNEEYPSKPVIWNMNASGQMGSEQYNQDVLKWSINQGFEQSPYFKK